MVDVLVLDDDKNVLSAIKRTFARIDVSNYGTSIPSEALTFLEEHKVKVLMVDQRMPEIAGLEFLSDIKNRFPYIVRILFTGYEDIAVTEQAINNGEVYKFIKKPWEENYLKNTIKEAVTKYDKEFSYRQLLMTIEQKNKELELLYKQQKLLSSTIAHELRSPLAGIKASLQILQSEQPGALSNEQKLFVDKGIAITNRVIRLANEVLDISKLEKGQQPLHLKQDDINKTVRDIIEEYEPIALEKGIVLEMEEKHIFPLMVFDKARVEEVLSNLINNAIKFTERGKIKVCVKEHGKQVRIAIEDTGIGIKEDDQKRIFEKFEQVSTKEGRKGCGLGLSIAKEIIAQHGGHMEVESKEGKGSEFSFTIPLDATEIFKKQREQDEQNER